MAFHTGTGTIVYDPYRGGMKTRTNWWCVLNIDTEITRYYRWWLEYERHIHLQPPSWDAHCSIVRGERPARQFESVWKKYHDNKIEFQYEHGNVMSDVSHRTDPGAIVNTGGVYYFIRVECPQLDHIRSELGLRTGYSYHLTIGRTYEYTPRKRGR